MTQIVRIISAISKRQSNTLQHLDPLNIHSNPLKDQKRRLPGTPTTLKSTLIRTSRSSYKTLKNNTTNSNT